MGWLLQHRPCSCPGPFGPICWTLGRSGPLIGPWAVRVHWLGMSRGSGHVPCPGWACPMAGWACPMSRGLGTHFGGPGTQVGGSVRPPEAEGRLFGGPGAEPLGIAPISAYFFIEHPEHQVACIRTAVFYAIRPSVLDHLVATLQHAALVGQSYRNTNSLPSGPPKIGQNI